MERQLKAHNLILVVFLLTVVVRFVESEPAPTLLEEIQVKGRLDVAMIGEPSQTGERPRGMRGFEHDLIELFADELGVEPHVVMARNPGMAFGMVHRGEASLAAGGLSPDDRVAYSFRFSPPYFQFTPQLVYLKGNGPPGSLEDIDISAVALGSYPAYSRDLGRLQADDPQLDRRTFDSIAALEQVWRGNARYAVAGSHDVLYGRRFFPGLRVAFEVSDPFPLAWAFPRTIDDSIFRAASEFLENASVDGRMQILMDRHFGHVKGFGDASSLTFLHRIDERLPSYRSLFEKVAVRTGMDWRLLAAMAYQESHWNPEAISSTGVHGLMMLTQAAADDLGIPDRQDPEDSVLGGARYFLHTKRRISTEITEPDRTWMALAAYNVGIGHLEDARRITRRLGDDPDLWRDVRKSLPLLSDPKVYPDTHYGYARGSEPVTYVRNIRNYLDILIWKTRAGPRDDTRYPVDAPEFETTGSRRDEPSLIPLGS